MLKKAGWVGAGLTLTVLSTLASISLGAGPAEAAVVYCKTVGVPKGCVVRPTAAVVAPVAAAAVVTPRVGVAGVGVGARGRRRSRRHADEPRRPGQPRRPPLSAKAQPAARVAVGKAARAMSA